MTTFEEVMAAIDRYSYAMQRHSKALWRGGDPDDPDVQRQEAKLQRAKTDLARVLNEYIDNRVKMILTDRAHHADI